MPTTHTSTHHVIVNGAPAGDNIADRVVQGGLSARGSGLPTLSEV